MKTWEVIIKAYNNGKVIEKRKINGDLEEVLDQVTNYSQNYIEIDEDNYIIELYI